MKKLFTSLFLFSAFFLMLILSDTTKAGALNGVNIWLFTLVPTLLPFMIISSVIMETESYNLISFTLKPVMKHIFRLPTDAGYPFFIGLLSGFPIGSKVTADMVKKGKLSVEEGNILITFCNNISPPFIISYLVSYVLKLSGTEAAYITAVMFLSPIITGMITSRIIPYLLRSPHRYIISSDKITNHTEQNNSRKRSIIDSCILNSFENIIKLGGYIILFTVLCSILSLFMNNSYLYCLISGILEITSGLNLFYSLPVCDAIIKAACVLTSFGGLCAMAQTYGMIQGSGLSLKLYACGKLLNSVITLLLISICHALI